MKDFYILWIILQEFDKHIILTYNNELLVEISELFKMMKKMPDNADITDFLKFVSSIIEKYKQYTASL